MLGQAALPTELMSQTGGTSGGEERHSISALPWTTGEVSRAMLK